MADGSYYATDHKHILCTILSFKQSWKWANLIPETCHLEVNFDFLNLKKHIMVRNHTWEIIFLGKSTFFQPCFDVWEYLSYQILWNIATLPRKTIFIEQGVQKNSPPFKYFMSLLITSQQTCFYVQIRVLYLESCWYQTWFHRGLVYLNARVFGSALTSILMLTSQTNCLISDQ